MNFTKKTLYMVGITMVFAGSLLAYFENYRNRGYIFIAIIVLLFLGWGVFFMQLIKGTIVGAKKIPFKRNKVKSFQRGVAKFFTLVIYWVIVFCNLLYVLHLSDDRKNDILQNGPTKTIVADIGEIETNQGRGGPTYQAIFQYSANGQLISHPYNENKGEFTEGQKYEIKYAVNYPEMFLIIKLVQ